VVSKRLSDEWWAQITHAFQAHVREEEQFLEAYHGLVEEVASPGMRFLVELILEDERRHHKLMQRMAYEARGEVDSETAPEIPDFSATDVDRLLSPTQRFLDAEREDRKKLQALAKELKPLRDESLWTLLVELMEIDTQKHVKILEYLERRLKSGR
jgi:rubrerythrin